MPRSAARLPRCPQHTANTLTAPYNDLEAVKQLFAENPDAIAGVILELIVGNAGFITPSPVSSKVFVKSPKSMALCWCLTK